MPSDEETKMAKKPNRGYKTLTDENDVDALSVATGGAVTAPINTTHRVGNTTTAANTNLYVQSETSKFACLGLISGTDVFALRTQADGTFSIDDDATAGKYALCTTAGAWAWGPASGLTGGHTIRYSGTGTSTPTTGLALSNSAGSVKLSLLAPNTASCDNEIYFECAGVNSGTIRYIRSNSRLYASSSTVDSGPYVAANGTSWTTGSDLRLKNITAEPVQGLSSVLAMNPIKYTRKAIDNDKVHLGFIAQEMLPLVPEVVDGDGTGDDMLGINYQALTPVLVKAIQELSVLKDSQAAILADLSAKLDEQAALLVEANARIAALESKVVDLEKA
jgi:hypothetical protein